MQRRICPICDHVMKHAHYCSFCKQWVSNPNVIHASYYLNECHRKHQLNEKKETAARFEPDAREWIETAGRAANDQKMLAAARAVSVLMFVFFLLLFFLQVLFPVFFFFL